MKFFEDMREHGGSIHDALQQMVKNMFREELDDNQIDEIIDKLSLSDILSLDTAYSANDKEAVQNILGPLPQLEYNMGGGRQASSQASTRPTTAGAAKKAAAKAAPEKTTTTTSTYSGGNQNVAPVIATVPDKSAPNEPDEELEEDADDTIDEYTDWVLCNNDTDTDDVTETNVVEMQTWLKRRAGIIT
jgi:hypothetical protein